MIGQVKWLIVGGSLAALVIGVASREAGNPHRPVAKLSRVSGASSPRSAEVAVYGDEVVVHRARDGHFQVKAEIDGVVIPFLVDTGASHVILSPADADRLGIYLVDSDFTQSYATANGTVRAAPVELSEITVGALRVSHVAASVNGAPLGQSLLGMSFLNRLRSFEVRGDDLVLRR